MSNQFSILIDIREREEDTSTSFAMWNTYMNTYLMAIIIVKGRLTPGLLLSHLGVMQQIYEQLGAVHNVQYRAAFMVPVFLSFCTLCFAFALCLTGVRYAL